MQERGVDLRRGRDELGERRPQDGEHLAHLGRRHPGLVVVEQRRVRRVGPLEALDVAALQLDVRAQVRQERGEVVVRRASTQAWWPRAASRVISTSSSVGTRRAFSQSRRVTRIRLASSESYGSDSLERREPVEQPPDLVVGEGVVGDAAERGLRLGASLGAERRHRDPLVPAEDALRLVEVADLGEALLEVCERAESPWPRSLPLGLDCDAPR